MMADSDGIAPHQHQWMVWTGPDGKLEVLANSSCPTCGLTPEAVANAAAVKTLLAEVERLRDRCREYRRQLELYGTTIVEDD